MPRVTISIIAPNHDLDQELITLDLAPGLSVADLKGFVEAETNIPPDSQQFYLNNQIISGDQKTLEEAGIHDGDMLAMIQRAPQRQQQTDMGSQRRQQPGQQRRQGGYTEQDSERLRMSILNNPTAMAQVRDQRPALADSINDPVRFREVFMEMNREDEQRERERLEQMRLLNEDPFNVEAQMKIEELIRQQAVQDNLHFAYEHNPEVFGRVTMLYIPVVVNKVPIKAFVDSGAQSTIVSPKCAEECGIMRLVDKRYSGVAKGVGTAQIIGRVHSADIRIGNSTMSCSFTVMEGKDVDMLLGLDMLRRFQAVIDLRSNKLVFGNDEVPFLPESEIPRFGEEEPTIAGPDGTEIGTETGTIKPAGSSSSGASQGPGRTTGSANGPSIRPTPAASIGGPAQSQPAPSSRGSSHSQEKIDQLVSLGFARAQAIQALDACDGNVEYAAGLLFQS